ncbi:MAG: NADPH-dependent 7-cyano-7-deazaguanine reductase QueF [Oscillatoria sp. SIO1A7]|nr:NADPH-dependent 7-cyano-7-deazaguanine reductase QueF [Oscillatoria sp. SIO1A7]
MSKTLLQYGDEAILEAASQPLEVWPNQSREHDYLIHIEHPEFTALCPRSGYPDFGIIVLEYYPDEWVVELKAFKLYINSFRQDRISHEAAINKIADRLFADVRPKAMRVIGDFMRRGNVKTVITVGRGQLMNFPEYQAKIL